MPMNAWRTRLRGVPRRVAVPRPSGCPESALPRRGCARSTRLRVPNNWRPASARAGTSIVGRPASTSIWAPARAIHYGPSPRSRHQGPARRRSRRPTRKKKGRPALCSRPGTMKAARDRFSAGPRSNCFFPGNVLRNRMRRAQMAK